MDGWRVGLTINDAFINSPPSCPSPGLSIFVNGSKPGVPLRVFVFPVDTRKLGNENRIPDGFGKSRFVVVRECFL